MTDRLTIGPDGVQEFLGEQIQVYRQVYKESSLVWVVDERDRVYLGGKPIGYNHSRAWRAAMTRYSPYTNPEDVDFCSQSMVDAIQRIIDGPPTVKVQRTVDIQR